MAQFAANLRWVWLLTVLSLVLAFDNLALGVEITAAEGVGADATIMYDDQDPDVVDLNFNESAADNFLEVRHNRYSYLRFDLATAPETTAAAGLTLMLGFRQTPPREYHVWALNDNVAGQDWGEETITWNTAPGIDNTKDPNIEEAFVLSDVTFLGLMPMPVEPPPIGPGGILLLSNQSLVDFVNADTDNQVTLILRSTGVTSQVIGSDNTDTLNPQIGFANIMFPTLSLPTDLETFEWQTADGGLWNSQPNWNLLIGSPPNRDTDSVLFGDAGGMITTDTTVVTNTEVNANSIEFDLSGSTYAVAGSGSVTLSGTNPTIINTNGSHQFQVEVNLGANTTIASNDPSGSLDFNNQIDLAGNVLTTSGTVNINQSVVDSVGGGMISSSGTLGTLGAAEIAGGLTSTGTLEIDISGAGTGQSDVFHVTGSANLEGSVAVDVFGSFTPDRDVTIMTTSHGINLTGPLSLAGDGAGFFSGGVRVVGNDLVLLVGSAIPEPTTWTLAMLGLLALQRRRKRPVENKPRTRLAPLLRPAALTIALALSAAIGNVASAIEITTADGVGADATVMDAYYSTNFNEGGTNFLEVRIDRYGYLRFDLTSAPLTTTAATLSMMVAFVQEDQLDYLVYGLNDNVSGQDWGEETITWETAPGINFWADPTAEEALILSAVTFLGNMPTPSLATRAPGDIFTFSSQPLVDFVNADTDGQVTFILRSAGTTVQAIGSDNTDTLPSIAPDPVMFPTLELVEMAGGLFEWKTPEFGFWDDQVNWDPITGSPPDSDTDTAVFRNAGGMITTDTTVVTNTGVTANMIEFDQSASTYVVAGTGSVTLAGISPTIVNTNGSHQFQVEVNLGADTSVASNDPNGNLDFNNQIDLAGNVLSTSGTVNVNHSVSDTVGNGSIFNSGTLGTAGTTQVDGNLTSTDTLAIDINGTGTGQTDHFVVNGTADLAGNLSVDVADNFAPSGTFEVVTADTLVGNLTLVGADAGLFSLDFNTVTGIVSLIAGSGGLAGDYNNNGVVDAADYVVWRDTLGSTSDLTADGVPNGVIDEADYVLWKDNFGATSSGNGGSAAVPEPSSWALAMLGLLTLRRRRKTVFEGN